MFIDSTTQEGLTGTVMTLTWLLITNTNLKVEPLANRTRTKEIEVVFSNIIRRTHSLVSSTGGSICCAHNGQFEPVHWTTRRSACALVYNKLLGTTDRTAPTIPAGVKSWVRIRVGICVKIYPKSFVQKCTQPGGR